MKLGSSSSSSLAWGLWSWRRRCSCWGNWRPTWAAGTWCCPRRWSTSGAERRGANGGGGGRGGRGAAGKTTLLAYTPTLSTPTLSSSALSTPSTPTHINNHTHRTALSTLLTWLAAPSLAKSFAVDCRPRTPREAALAAMPAPGMPAADGWFRVATAGAAAPPAGGAATFAFAAAAAGGAGGGGGGTPGGGGGGGLGSPIPGVATLGSTSPSIRFSMSRGMSDTLGSLSTPSTPPAGGGAGGAHHVHSHHSHHHSYHHLHSGLGQREAAAQDWFASLELSGGLGMGTPAVPAI